MSTMKLYQELISRLHLSESLGMRTASNGAILIGHVPHVAPEAWLHELYPPLNFSDIEQLSMKIQRKIPVALVELYSVTNGLSMFSGSLSIDGRRGLNIREGDGVWQPFDLIVPNTLERPNDGDSDAIFFGGFRKDGSQLFIKSDASIVYRCERWKAKKVLSQWLDLPTMLLSEFERLSKLFDTGGRKIE